jgi:hypothetical protein
MGSRAEVSAPRGRAWGGLRGGLVPSVLVWLVPPAARETAKGHEADDGDD